MANQTNNLVLVEAGLTRTIDASADTIVIGAAVSLSNGLTVSSGGVAITGDSSVTGDLTVTGDIISRGQSNLLIKDAIIDLAVGNTSTISTPGGFALQMNRNSGFTAGGVTAFVAGVVATSAPTFTNTDAGSSTPFAANDIVAISGSKDANNDGLYVVASVSGASFPQTVTIKGIGGTAVNGYTPFAQNQFTTDSGNTASAYKVDLAVLIFADGSANFKDGAGSTYAKGTLISAYKANAADTDFTGNGAYTVPTVTETLQAAYNGGPTITTASTTPVTFTLSSGGFTVNGSGAVDIGDTGTDVGGFAVGTSTFDINATGAVTIDGVGTSNLTAASGNLTLSTTTSGNLVLQSVAQATIDGTVVSIDGTDNSNLTVTGSGKSLTVSAAGGGAQQLLLQSAGTGTPGATPAIGLAATAGGFDLQSVLSSRLRMNTNSGSDQTLTLEALNSGAGQGIVTVRAEDLVNIGDFATFANALVYLNHWTYAAKAMGVRPTAGEVIAAGEAVYAAYDGGSSTTRYYKASNTAGTTPGRTIAGIAQSAAASAGTTFNLSSVPGLFISTSLVATSGDVGASVYLGTGGALTLTAPTASGSTVFKAGFVHTYDGGISGNAVICFQPQFIAKIP